MRVIVMTFGFLRHVILLKGYSGIFFFGALYQVIIDLKHISHSRFLLEKRLKLSAWKLDYTVLQRGTTVPHCLGDNKI